MKQMLLLAPGALLLLSSYQKEDLPQADCTTQAVETTAVTCWNTRTYCFVTPVEGGKYQAYVINSATELQALNHCTTTPAIDFARYTLLVVKTKTAECRSVKTQQVVRSCAQYTVQVTLAAGACQASTEVLYYTLVPRLAAGAQVAFEVTLP